MLIIITDFEEEMIRDTVNIPQRQLQVPLVYPQTIYN